MGTKSNCMSQVVHKAVCSLLCQTLSITVACSVRHRDSCPMWWYTIMAPALVMKEGMAHTGRQDLLVSNPVTPAVLDLTIPQNQASPLSMSYTPPNLPAVNPWSPPPASTVELSVSNPVYYIPAQSTLPSPPSMSCTHPSL